MLQPPQSAFYALLELKKYYLEMIDFYSCQLEHVEALLKEYTPALSANAELIKVEDESQSKEAEIEDLEEDENLEILPKWQGITRIDAIEKILLNAVGKAVHIDVVIYELYGKQALKPYVAKEQYKLVKDRISAALRSGKQQDKWFSVPNNRGCYTYDLAALERPVKVIN